MISGIIILYSVFKIRQFIKGGLESNQINERNIMLHAAAFLLYLSSLIAKYVLLRIEVKHHDPLSWCILAGIITNVFNFVGQLLLCKILYQFGKPL